MEGAQGQGGERPALSERGERAQSDPAVLGLPLPARDVSTGTARQRDNFQSWSGTAGACVTQRHMAASCILVHLLRGLHAPGGGGDFLTRALGPTQEEEGGQRQLSLRMVRDCQLPVGSFGGLLPGCGRDVKVTGVFVGWNR